MTTFSRAILSLAVTGAIFGTVAFFGYSPFVKTIVQIAGATSQGSTGSTARQYNIYGVNLASAGANATSSSVQNTTGQDMYVTAVKAGCEGVGTSKTAYTGTGLAALTLSVGTSSTAAPSVVPTNLVASAFTVATGTSYFLLASSTNGVSTANGAGIWPAGAYMTFWVNATNTAVCTFGVDGFSA